MGIAKWWQDRQRRKELLQLYGGAVEDLKTLNDFLAHYAPPDGALKNTIQGMHELQSVVAARVKSLESGTLDGLYYGAAMEDFHILVGAVKQLLMPEEGFTQLHPARAGVRDAVTLDSERYKRSLEAVGRLASSETSIKQDMMKAVSTVNAQVNLRSSTVREGLLELLDKLAHQKIDPEMAKLKYWWKAHLCAMQWHERYVDPQYAGAAECSEALELLEKLARWQFGSRNPQLFTPRDIDLLYHTTLTTDEPRFSQQVIEKRKISADNFPSMTFAVNVESPEGKRHPHISSKTFYKSITRMELPVKLEDFIGGERREAMLSLLQEIAESRIREGTASREDFPRMQQSVSYSSDLGAEEHAFYAEVREGWRREAASLDPALAPNSHSTTATPEPSHLSAVDTELRRRGSVAAGGGITFP